MHIRLGNHTKLTVYLLAGVMVTAVFGCSWPGSHLQHNWTVEAQFEESTIYNDHQYFTGGTLEDPRAILVLKPEYKLESEDWQAVNMTPGELSQWVTALKKDFFTGYNTFANGAEIISNTGEVAGYYYSAWEFPLVRMVDAKTLNVSVPRAEYRSTNMRIEFFVGDDNLDNH